MLLQLVHTFADEYRKWIQLMLLTFLYLHTFHFHIYIHVCKCCIYDDDLYLIKSINILFC